jgi:hypothetical protein
VHKEIFIPHPRHRIRATPEELRLCDTYEFNAERSWMRYSFYSANHSRCPASDL